MNLYLDRPEYKYEIENICRVFIPNVRFFYPDTLVENREYIKFDYTENTVECSVFIDNTIYSEKKIFKDFKDGEIVSAVCVYSIFSKHFGFSPRWGVLTGVRPAKLYSMLTEKMGREYAEQRFSDKLLVSKEKTKLCSFAYDAEKSALNFNSPDSFSLYVSVPFCPSRCSYCSFVSHSIEKAGKLISKYVELLCEEIKYTAQLAEKLGLKLKTVYYGGGTPTTLTENQLFSVMQAIEKNFDLSFLREYTIEAGRPDTVTKEKLDVMYSNGCNRISINPQTMQNEILKNIGRKHTVEQTKIAFDLARKVGFDNINMDLIAGLNGDTFEGFQYSLDRILSDEFSPENVTVHTLSLKRASNIVTEKQMDYSAGCDLTSEMQNYSAKRLFEKGYSPYYLYRQSKMLGNLENVGWSRAGYDCLYNIYMMNEIHTVLSVGAGGVSRLKNPFGSQIERVFNYKFPYEYNDRFDEIIKRKEQVVDFYDTYSKTEKNPTS